MARLISLGGAHPVDEGEALVVGHLSKILPDDFLLYPNIEITEPHRQPFEYDLVVVAPHAIYVIEIKRWTKRIVGGDHIWQLASGITKPNPLRLTNNKARVLRSKLTNFSLSLKDVW